jgi:hypothetical protein
MRMTVVTEPDNRRDKGDRDSDFCNGSHDASILLHVQFPYAGRFTVLAVVPVWEKRGPASVLAAGLKLSD